MACEYKNRSAVKAHSSEPGLLSFSFRLIGLQCHICLFCSLLFGLIIIETKQDDTVVTFFITHAVIIQHVSRDVCSFEPPV